MDGIKETNGHHDHLRPSVLEEGELSTMELLDHDPVQLSTERLLNEPARDLSVEKPLHAINYNDEIPKKENNIENELANFNSMKISEDIPLINEYDISTPPNKFNQIPSRDNAAPQPKNFTSDEQLLEILPKLLNKIQVFLLNNSYSLHFLKRFQAYVGYLIKFGLDPFDDENVLDVQDCVMGPVLLRKEMEFIIKKFLFQPDNLIMKLVAFESSKNNNILQMHFSLWRIRQVTENSLKLYEKFIKAKFLQKWVTSYEKYGINYKEQSDDINETRLKEFAFDKILVANDTLRRMDLVADSKLKQSYFLRFKKVYSTFKENEAIFKQRQDDIVRKLYLKKWLLNFKLSSYQPNTIVIKEKMFSKMIHGCKTLEDMVDKALYARYLFVSKTTMNLWKNKFEKHIDANSKLLTVQNRFVKRKYLNRLSSSYRDLQIVEEAATHLDNVLKSFILQKIWYKRLQEKLHLYSYESIINERIQRRYLHKMTKEFYLELKADQFRREQDQKLVWGIWKNQYTLQETLRDFKSNDLNKNFFQRWNHQTKLRLTYKNEVSKRLALKYFNKWKSRDIDILQCNRRSSIMYENLIRKKYFSALKKKYFGIRLLNQKVYLHLKVGTIKKLKGFLIKIKELEMIKDQKWPLIDMHIIQSNYLLKWKKSYTKARDDKLIQNLEIYTSQRQNKLKNKYFQIYHRQSVIINQNLNVIANDMNDRRLIKSCFNKAIIKLDDNQADYIYADSIKNGTVLKDLFTLWKFRIDELDAILQEVTNEKNLYLLSSYLRIWSMNHFKIARNERTVQLFRQRWERAALRGLIQLWKMKSSNALLSNNEPFGDIENGDSVFDRDEVNSTISNISPHHIMEIETPRRQEGNTAIPGSLRMRRYKMQEMISHYNRARIIPSPLKESTTLPNTVKRRLQPNNNGSPVEYPIPRQKQVGSPGKLQFSNLTSLKPPSQYRAVKHRSQSVLNGSPERRQPLNRLSGTTDNLR